MEGESIVEVEQSEVLTEEEVASIVDGVEPEEAVLPSDEVEFEVPEKFKNKSSEDIIKAYLELEKMKAKAEPEEVEVVAEPDEGGDEESQEEKPEGEETSDKQAQYDKYLQSFEENGELSEAEYAELEKAGHDKTAVDNEIARHKEQKEFQQYKADKQLNTILEPLGGGVDKFKEVAAWANESKPAEEVQAFNAALADSNAIAQQAMLKGLYAEFESSVQETDTVLHSGSRQTTPSKGYKTQEEFFKDVGSPEYQNNPSYRAAVEKKMSLSGDLF